MLRISVGIILASLAIATVQGQSGASFQCPANGYITTDTLCPTCSAYCPAPAPVNPLNVADNICFDTGYGRLSEYMSSARQDYYYSLEWDQNSQTSGVLYFHNGELAHVATTALPGTVPIYDYWNGQHNLESALPQPGFTPIKVYYYVSQQRQTGQFALMRFNKGATNRLALEYDSDILQKRGWTFQETLGYTYRPCPSSFIN